jgi:hypothetical protein
VARWSDIAAGDPEFAKKVQQRFDRYKHKVIATLRKDGSPRVSGIEAEFRDGDVWLGMMPGSLKAVDLDRDPRLALHSGTEDPEGSSDPGMAIDAKLSGTAVAAAPKRGKGKPKLPGLYFRVDIDEVVLITLGETRDHLLIEHWRKGAGLKATKRY